MPAVPTLFLAPTAAIAHNAAWQFVLQSGISPLDPPLIFTGASSAEQWRELARQGGHGTRATPRLIRAEEFFARSHAASARARYLSGADRLWVMASVLRRAANSEALERLTKSHDFASQFVNWIAALRRSGLEEFPRSEWSEELNYLLNRYNAKLQTLKAFDIEAAPTLFSVSAPRNRAFVWPRTLVVDDGLDPSPALQRGLKALLSRAESVVVTLVCPGGIETNPAIEGALQFWLSQGAQIVRVGDFASTTSRAAARVLGEETEVERPAQVALTAAHTPWDEMNRIAAQIRVEVENGALPDDFALAVANTSTYEWPARHAFAAHGVPLDWPRDRPLRTSPLVRALLLAAQSCRDQWNVHELHDIFGDGTLRLHLEDQQFEARRLRAAARAARHPELDDLERTHAAFEAKIAQFTAHPKNDEARQRAAIEASLVAGDLEMLAHFKTLCATSGEKLGASAWQLRFFALIDDLAGHWLEAEGEAAQLAQSAIERLKKAVECVAERARGWSDEETDEMQCSGAEWLRWLELEIDGATRSPNESGGVQVGSASAPPDAAHTLFFCGLNEGAWPLSSQVGSLGEGGRELNCVLRSHESSPIARAAHVLARALGQGRVSFSYANFVDGHETPASPVLDDLRAAWPQKECGPWPELARLNEIQNRSRRAHLTALNRWISSGSPRAQSCPHLQTLAQMRLQRRDLVMGVYDGVLGAYGRTLMDSWKQLRRSDALSGSALEKYARCPLRYFFESILGLEEDEDLADDLDPRAAGNLVHAITYQFFKGWPRVLTSDDFEDALHQLASITKRECEKLPIRPILREAEYHRLMGADEKSGPLVKWLKLEISGGNGAWTQEMHPLSQSSIPMEGMGDGLEQRFQFQIGDQEIRGVIDRLDIASDTSQVAVLDYKTGDISSLPSWRSGDNGLHFQLAIYALAARDLTRGWDNPPRLAMAYLSLRRAKIARGIGQEGTLGKGCSGAKTLPDDAFEAWLDDVKTRAARIADLRSAGTFNIALQSAQDAKCDSCGSKSLCGQHKGTQTARREKYLASTDFYAPDLWEWD